MEINKNSFLIYYLFGLKVQFASLKLIERGFIYVSLSELATRLNCIESKKESTREEIILVTTLTI